MLIYSCAGLVAEAAPGAQATAGVITEAGAAPVSAENGHHHHHHHHRHLLQTGNGLELATPWLVSEQQDWTGLDRTSICSCSSGGKQQP